MILADTEFLQFILSKHQLELSFWDLYPQGALTKGYKHTCLHQSKIVEGNGHLQYNFFIYQKCCSCKNMCMVPLYFDMTLSNRLEILH